MDRERELLESFKKLKEDYEQIEEIKSKAYHALEKAKRELAEYLEDSGKEKTAEYKDIGHATLLEPTPMGSYLKENEDRIYAWVRSIDREDVIRPTIHWRTLSSLIKECREHGIELPVQMDVYDKPNIRLMKK